MPRSVSSPRVLSFTLLAVFASIPLACGGGDDTDAGLINITGGPGTNSNKGIPAVDAGSDATVGTPDAAVDAGVDATTAVDAGLGCSDGVKDNLETDVDCGGTVCAPCKDGKMCTELTDCLGMGCTNKICVTPTCTDNVLNENETDVDCGGVCPVCTVGRKCAASSDCSSKSCNNGTCQCPSDTVIVPQAELLGGAYCIDTTEVTKGAYAKFLTASYPIGDQSGGCSATTNPNYVPLGDWPPAVGPVAAGYPVHYVNWCDAYAYCKWNGRELCGNIGGGAMPDGLTATDLNRATTGMAGSADAGDGGNPPLDAWYNACSIQGVNLYPYDRTTYSPGVCNDGTNATQSSPASTWPDLDGSGNPTNLGCQGGADGLLQMSGNVAEWENACSGTTGPTDQCSLRGGSYASNQTDLECPWHSDEHLDRIPTDVSTLATVGFRCCQY